MSGGPIHPSHASLLPADVLGELTERTNGVDFSLLGGESLGWVMLVEPGISSKQWDQLGMATTGWTFDDAMIHPQSTGNYSPVRWQQTIWNILGKHYACVTYWSRMMAVHYDHAGTSKGLTVQQVTDEWMRSKGIEIAHQGEGS